MKWSANQITYDYDEEKCTCGLGLCTEACGQGVLDYLEGPDKMDIVNEVQCIFCRQCEDICPTGAITIQGALTVNDIQGLNN
jgi:NAD-dependent dihydropyrimidine dehydrogenase PreA subunit